MNVSLWCVCSQHAMIEKHIHIINHLSYVFLFGFQLQLQKTQYLQLGPNRGPYYGGSLPNVNQIGNNTVEVPFQVSSW